MRKLYTALLAGAVFAAPATAANQIVNGSFETGDFTGWTVGGTSGDGYPPVVISYGNTSAYPGGAFGESIPADNALSPSTDDVGTHAAYFVADLARPQTLSQAVSINAGQSYTFGFDVYLPFNGAANGNDATLSATVGGLTFASFSASGEPAGKWLHFQDTEVATITGNSTFEFDFNSFGVPAKDFVVDRVFFGADIGSVPEAATWAMMVGGFGLVGGALRRRSRVGARFA